MSTRRSRIQATILSLLSCIVLLTFIVAARSLDMKKRDMGAKITFGKGSVSTYAEFDDSGAPSAIGVQFDAAGLQSPPAGHTDMHHCADRNGDGMVEKPDECVMTHEFVIALPSDIASRDDVPFKWVLLNWNPVGHIPPGIYDVPHFDVHFMMAPVEQIFAIHEGGCGPEFVDCDEFKIAQKTVPANYAPPEFKDVGAVAPAMGNHLVDVTGEEFHGVPWTHSFVYGAYNGAVTFWEEMLTKDYLESANKCTPIKQPAGVAVAGYYPTQSCARKDDMGDGYSVSLEGFEHREASPPGAMDSRVPPPPPPDAAPAPQK